MLCGTQLFAADSHAGCAGRDQPHPKLIIINGPPHAKLVCKPSASGAPDARVVLWSRLLEPAAAPLLSAVSACDVFDAAFVERLRRSWPADLVTAAIELTSARRSAARKFPNAATLVADVVGVEQATSHAVAEHKAQRFARLGVPDLLDLCCGIGGDAMSLARASRVTAFDLDPLKSWMAARNARCETRDADVTTIDFATAVVHCDPSRRGRGRRYWRYEDYEPGPPFIERLVDQCPAAAIKLGPGVELDRLPGPGPEPRAGVGPGAPATEIELISEHGTLVQAVLWSGQLAFHPGQRTATMLPDGATLTGVPSDPPIGSLGSFVHTVDPAIERAGLLGELCAQLDLVAIHPMLGLLTSNRFLANPWLTPFELVAVVPWRPRTVKRWLSEHHAGIVEVKTRGQAVDPDIVQRHLRGSGDERFVVFILRMDRRVQALIARRA